MPPRKTTLPTANDAPPTFSAPWMARWLDEATRTGCLLQAAQAAGVTLDQVQRARGSDPAFDEAHRAHDRAVDQKIAEAVRAAAMRGDARSLTLYYGRVRELVLGPEAADDGGDPSPFPAEVAAAMIRAGLAAGPPCDRAAPRRARRVAPRAPRPALEEGGDEG